MVIFLNTDKSFVITYKNKTLINFNYPEYLGYCRKITSFDEVIIYPNCSLRLEGLEMIPNIDKLAKGIRECMNPDTFIDINSHYNKYKNELQKFINYLQPFEYYRYFANIAFPGIIPISSMNNIIAERLENNFTGNITIDTKEIKYIYFDIFLDDEDIIYKKIHYGTKSKKILNSSVFKNYINKLSKTLRFSKILDKLNDYDWLIVNYI